MRSDLVFALIIIAAGALGLLISAANEKLETRRWRKAWHERDERMEQIYGRSTDSGDERRELRGNSEDVPRDVRER